MGLRSSELQAGAVAPRRLRARSRSPSGKPGRLGTGTRARHTRARSCGPGDAVLVRLAHGGYMKTLQHSRRLGWALLVVVAPGAFLVGCGQTDSSGPTTPAPSSSST